MTTKDKRVRSHIYFILGKIGKNSWNKKIADILLHRLPKETDKYVLRPMVDLLAEQPTIDDCGPLMPYINDSHSHVRYSAMDVLKICKYPKVEDIW